MKSKKKPPLFSSRRFVLLISLLAGFVMWVVIAGFIDPGRAVTIRDVPIDYEYNEAAYQANDLMIVSPAKDLFAEVEVTGDGAEIAPLMNSPDAVQVVADYSAITGPGTFEVPLRPTKVAPGSWRVLGLSTITDGHSLDTAPYSRVTLTFEKMASKTLPVAVNAENITAAEGYFTGTPVITPESVTIRGPQSKVELVHSAVATLGQSEELSQRKQYMGVNVLLRDENGQPVDAEANNINISPTAVEVDISVLMLRRMNLQAEFINLPALFDEEWFYQRVRLSDDTVEVMGPAAAFDAYGDTITMASFNGADLGLNWESEEITIPLPEDSGLRISDEQRTVRVSFDTTGLVEKTFEIPVGDGNVRNGPLGADITAVQETVTVKLLGPPEQMDTLLPEDISVEISANGVSATSSGQQSLAARILAPGANRCIPLGRYSIVCDVEPSS